MPVIKMKLTPESIDQAIKELTLYRDRVKDAGEKIARELGKLGYEVAYQVMSGHVFSGETIESLTLLQGEKENQYILMAKSQAILFFEFGAGAKYGEGHPWDDALDMGPGTYPGNGHWDDPNGWWFPTSDPRLIRRVDKSGQGWGHSYGNKPHMPFYKADKEMRDKLLEIAKAVLQGREPS